MKDIIISLNKAVQADILEPDTAYILCVSDPRIQIPDSDHILGLCFQDITDDQSSDVLQNEHTRQIACFFERVQENEKINCIFRKQ